MVDRCWGVLGFFSCRADFRRAQVLLAQISDPVRLQVRCPRASHAAPVVREVVQLAPWLRYAALPQLPKTDLLTFGFCLFGQRVGPLNCQTPDLSTFGSSLSFCWSTCCRGPDFLGASTPTAVGLATGMSASRA